jgi:hypothetical protein
VGDEEALEPTAARPAAARLQRAAFIFVIPDVQPDDRRRLGAGRLAAGIVTPQNNLTDDDDDEDEPAILGQYRA